MKHVTSFESFVNESAFHAALANAKKQGLKEFEFQGKKYPVHEDAMDESTLNEASNKYYTIDWNRDNEKQMYDYKIKTLDFAEKAIKALPKILDECCPDTFDTENLGFAFRGNTNFVYANIPDAKKRIGVDYSALEKNQEFAKYFDDAGANLEAQSNKMYCSSFRLNII